MFYLERGEEEEKRGLVPMHLVEGLSAAAVPR